MRWPPPFNIKNYFFVWQYGAWQVVKNQPFQWGSGFIVPPFFAQAPTRVQLVHSPVPWLNITLGILQPFDQIIPFIL